MHANPRAESETAVISVLICGTTRQARGVRGRVAFLRLSEFDSPDPHSTHALESKGARHIRDTFYGAVTDWGLVVSCSQIRDGS